MTRLTHLLTERLGVFRSGGSFARVAAWVVVWSVLISLVVAPDRPDHTDRPHDADVPASDVRYVGPLSRRDTSGFLPPPDAATPEFRLAWIGGSEIKLREVSVPGAFRNRVAAVGDEPLVIDSYNLIAPRLIDMLRAVDAAAATDVDAVVVALNPAWIRSEWSMQGWPALDVGHLGTLWSRPATWPWAAAFTSPGDVAWRLAREASPIVTAQTRLNARLRDELARFDLLDHHADHPADQPAAAPGDARLPTDATAFWLTREYGPEVVADEDDRVAGIVRGVGPSQDEARFFVQLLLEALADLDVPVYLYATPFSRESLADPDFAEAVAEISQFWASVEPPEPQVVIDPTPWPEPPPGLFLNNVHMADVGPFVDLLVERLCALWSSADPERRCS